MTIGMKGEWALRKEEPVATKGEVDHRGHAGKESHGRRVVQEASISDTLAFILSVSKHSLCTS